MKTIAKTVLFLVVLSTILMAFKSEEHATIKIGSNMPNIDTPMKGIDGKEYTLEKIGKEKGTLVIFSCNTCPFVVGRGENTEGWQKRYNGIQQLCDELKVGMVLVNSNEAKRDDEDSYEAMVKFAKEKQQKSIYVVDKNSIVADAFGAKTTPHVFLFDANRKLIYKGAIDDSVDSPEKVTKHYLKNALKQHAEGGKIKISESKALGCSIKRVKH